LKSAEGIHNLEAEFCSKFTTYLEACVKLPITLGFLQSFQFEGEERLRSISWKTNFL